MDSTRLEHELRLAPVNLGLALPFGLEFMLNEIPVSHLQPGDVVLLNLEYEHFWSDALALGDLYGVIRVCPSCARFLSAHAAKRLLDEGIPLFTDELRQCVHSLRADRNLDKEGAALYRRHSFDQYGDFVAQWDCASRLTDASPRMVENFKIASSRLGEVIQLLNTFNQRCQKQGARVFLMYPAYPEHLFYRHAAEICRVDATLRAKLKFPILNQPQSALAPLDQFFDNPYHLRRAGVDWRTSQVIDALRPRVQFFSRYDTGRHARAF